jgi:putative ABC transport system ATP-binding protein
MSPSADAVPAYALSTVSKEYGSGGGKVRALQDIDLVIAEGEFVAIVGASGSGKTTMLQLLGALDTPTNGEIRCKGRNLSAANDAELTRLRRQSIGFIFQQFNLIPTMTAMQNIEAALAPQHVGRSAAQQRARELLSMVGLASRADHLPSQLSGGEQQRVAIARALANHPSILLADEPTGNLDADTGAEILVLLRDLSRKHGHTVIVVTHDADIATQAHRIVRIRDGRLRDDVVTAEA